MTFRPPQYARAQTYSLTCTLPSQAAQNPQSSVSSNQSAPTTFFFDAVMRAEHAEEVVMTHHPVQNGASITDHAYAAPARLVLEVGFSDLQDSFVAEQYSGGSQSKSVNAYAQFKQIKDLRLPCQVATRLQQYDNMVIEQLLAPETNAQVASATMVIRFLQIIVATVDSQAVSARAQQTDTTNEGTKTPTSVPDNLLQYQDTSTGQWGDGPFNQ